MPRMRVDKSQKTQQAVPRISSKEAVAKAINYYVDLMGVQPVNLKIEELEKDTDDDGRGPFWFITLGFDEPQQTSFVFAPARRSYKIFKVDISTGEVLSMKIKTV